MVKVLYDSNRLFPSAEEPPSFFRFWPSVFNPVKCFEIVWKNIIEYIHQLTYRGHYNMGELMDTEFYFVNYLFERLQKQVEEENKQKEKEQKMQEEEYKRQEAMQKQSMSQYMPSMPSMPKY